MPKMSSGGGGGGGGGGKLCDDAGGGCHTRLYDLLGVSPSCSAADIIKAYRLRALQLHPDKNKQQDAHNMFIQLQQAYAILRDEKKRKRYDRTGCEEEQTTEFEAAYDWFRCNAPRVEEEDIESFRKDYRNSDMEEEDLISFYQKYSGDVALLLEYIPYSEAEDVDRFIKICKKLFKEKKLKESDKFEESISALRKNAVKYNKKLEKERKEHQKLQKDNQENKRTKTASLESLADLEAAIQTNAVRRSAAAGGFLDALAEKYKSKKDKERHHSDPSEEEFQAIQSRLDKRASSSASSSSRKRPKAGGGGGKSEKM
eukprot:GHVS01057944.1.p1 GENE.GHVS01057944.1~~GHVS01057944.1.p1  ORF type:complete len:315 (+),score=95.81 GHVS01057944.1:200-1144(+)